MHRGLTPVWCLLFFICAPLVYAASPHPPLQEETSAEGPLILQEEQIKSPSALDPGTVTLGGDSERLRPKRAREFQIGNTTVTVTGAAFFDAEYQDNFNLRTTRNRDELQLKPKANLDVILDFPNGVSLFTETRIRNRTTLQYGDKPMNDFQLLVRDFFVNIPLPLPVPAMLRLGRQQFFEPRRWYLNNRLDGIRLFLDPAPFHLFVSLSTPVPSHSDSIRLFDNIFRRRTQTDLIANLTYSLSTKSSIGSYVIVGSKHENRIKRGNPPEEDPIWIGFRVYGKENVTLPFKSPKFLKQLFKPKIQYWLDAAFVTGSAKSKEIRGFGLDLGLTAIARKIALKPYITMAYAFGSGDKTTKDGVDHNFRQTGFQLNSGVFGGVVNFNYYGVLLQPELSNIHIATAGLGFRPSKKSSIELVYHHYSQYHAVSKLRDEAISRDPRGKTTNLGDEFDIILGSREIENVRIRFRNGYFLPGPAYGRRDDPAFFTRLDIQFSF